MPDVAGKQKLDPVFADISIVKDDKDLSSKIESPQLGGVRIKQRFATGTAAVNAATNRDMGQKLRKAVYGDPVLEKLEKAKTRFDKEGVLQEKFNKMDSAKQQAYLQILNETFGKKDGSAITTGNFQTEIGQLNDTQLEVASQQIQSF